MKYHKRYLEAHNIERMKYLSGLLKEFRLNSGYSREDLEREHGISRAVIQRAESSDPVNLTLKTIFEIADVFMISPEELFQGVE